MRFVLTFYRITFVHQNYLCRRHDLCLHDLCLRALLASPHLLVQRYVRFGSMGKRPQDQGSPSRKRPATEHTPEIPADARSTPTRPATEQTPEIPAEAEATMAWLSTIDDVPLISIFEHFANCYVAKPMVGTCRRIFITWTRKRRQMALEELTILMCWLDERVQSTRVCESVQINRSIDITGEILRSARSHLLYVKSRRALLRLCDNSRVLRTLHGREDH